MAVLGVVARLVLTRSSLPSDLPDPDINPQLVTAFLALQLSGGFGLFLVVLTALGSQRVKRNSSWYTFLVAWIISCISYTLVFLFGQQNAPSFGPCVTQAAGIYSAPALTSSATLAFAIDMLLGVRATSPQLPLMRRKWVTLMLLFIPYVLWLAVFVGMLAFGVSNPAQTRRGPNGTYCDFVSDIPSKISSFITIGTTLVLLVIEGYIATCLIRNRNLLKDRQLSAMAVRVIVFSVLGALGLGVGIAYELYSIPGASFDIIMATLPLGGFLIFGTQMDLVNVWLFWRTQPPRPASQYADLKSAAIPDVPTPRSERAKFMVSV